MLGILLFFQTACLAVLLNRLADALNCLAYVKELHICFSKLSIGIAANSLLRYMYYLDDTIAALNFVAEFRC